MMLPPDVVDYVERHFPPDDRAAAIEVIAHSKLHDASATEDRLLRCLAVASRGSLAALRQYVDLLAIDYRDVIVAGEYESRNGFLARVRDLAHPIPVELVMDMTPKQIALEFLRLVTSNQIAEAYERFVAPGFRHHNPWFQGDATSLMAGMQDNAARNPDKLFEVKNAIAEGERVAVHSHLRMQPGDRGMVVVHIFRFEGGRIAELWDLGQAIPEENLNENGMF